MDLTSVSTAALVAELATREGVTAEKAGPYQEVTVSVDGPAVILVVVD